MGEYTVIASRRVVPTLPFFADHFPNNPIVPAFIQLAWVREAYEAFSPHRVVTTMSKVKFLKPMLPGNKITITLDTGAHSCNFKILVGDTVATKGTLTTETMPVENSDVEASAVPLLQER